MSRSPLLLALVTLLLWSCSACCMSRLTGFPAARIVALSFICGGLVGLFHWRSWKVPLRTFLVCTLCFVAYRLLVMASFKLAPVIEANLVNGLNPLLIVLLTPVVLDGYPVRPHHVVGALLGFSGAVLAVTGGHVAFELHYLPGYALSAAAAVLWAVYALLLKRLPPFSSMAVGGFMVSAGLICLAIDAVGSRGAAPSAPLTTEAWLWIALLGLGPTGLAYITWDAAMKRGDPRIIGSIMYLAPLSSTVLVGLVEHRPLTPVIGLAAALLTLGATVSSWTIIRDGLRGAPPEAVPRENTASRVVQPVAAR